MNYPVARTSDLQRREEDFKARQKSVSNCPEEGIPKNNTPELAQWFLERGHEQVQNGGLWMLLAAPVGLISVALGAFCVVSPMFWPNTSILFVLLGLIFLPFGYVAIKGSFEPRQEGKRKIAIGEAMNEAAGRENYVRPKGFRGTQFMSGWSNGPNTRYGDVPTEPPVVVIW